MDEVLIIDFEIITVSLLEKVYSALLSVEFGLTPFSSTVMFESVDIEVAAPEVNKVDDNIIMLNNTARTGSFPNIDVI